MLPNATPELHRVNKRLQEAYRQIDEELTLARSLRDSFLPQSLPKVPHSRFAVHHRRGDRIGGDCYDVFRLDENHVGFYLADVMGHGVAATLLTMFIKANLRAKEVVGSQYRLAPPDEVLTRLNRDLIELRLSEQPFISMIYGLFNHETGALSLTRAGQPCPLFMPSTGEPILWQQEGLLLGVVDAHYPPRTAVLQPGDRVLLYSEGVETTTFEGRSPGAESLLACAARHRDLSLARFVEKMGRDLAGAETQPGDLTMFGVEMTA
jgi:sigma-B regulation protein RsbU (phosphoserine phosphatase)